MWVPASLNGPVNHVVPLLHTEVKERDEGHYSIRIDSQNVCCNSFGDRRDSRTMKCKHCLRDYHTTCILATAYDENWSCHCFVKPDMLKAVCHWFGKTISYISLAVENKAMAILSYATLYNNRDQKRK